uniref:Uncharacterized protein n=1 Tax=Acrobeloides nanus TaxID=290746 RepID=A0A914EP60_9BILA
MRTWLSGSAPGFESNGLGFEFGKECPSARTTLVRPILTTDNPCPSRLDRGQALSVLSADKPCPSYDCPCCPRTSLVRLTRCPSCPRTSLVRVVRGQAFELVMNTLGIPESTVHDDIQRYGEYGSDR